jgi:phosphoglycolate phosphatase
LNTKPTSPRIPIATVGAVIFDQAGKALMLRTHKWSNLWGIPGGKIKFGETSEAALRREIKEETNLEVDDVRFVLVQDCIHSKEFYREAHFILLNYTCVARNPSEVRLNDEAEEFRWLELSQCFSLPLNSPTRILLERITGANPDSRSGRPRPGPSSPGAGPPA